MDNKNIETIKEENNGKAHNNHSAGHGGGGNHNGTGNHNRTGNHSGQGNHGNGGRTHKRKSGKSKKRKIGMLSVALTFFMTVSLFVIYISSTLYIGYFSGRSWNTYVSKNTYRNQIAQKVKDDIVNVMMQRGITEYDSRKMISLDTLKTNYGYYVDAIVQEKETDTGDVEEFKKDLKAKLEQYMKENKVAQTNTLNEEIDIITKEAGAIYERDIRPVWLERLSEYSKDKIANLKIYLIISSIICIVVAVCLWLLHEYRHRALRYWCIATGTAAAWSLGIVTALSRTGWIADAGVGPGFYREFVVEFLKQGTQVGILLVGLEIVLTLGIALCMKKMKHKVS